MSDDEPDLFGPTLGDKLRDEGMDRVLHDDFAAEAFATIRAFIPVGEAVTGERVRKILTELDVVPHDAHAWGALINQAIKGGLLEPTGVRVKMDDPRSHSRKTDVYIRR